MQGLKLSLGTCAYCIRVMVQVRCFTLWTQLLVTVPKRQQVVVRVLVILTHSTEDADGAAVTCFWLDLPLGYCSHLESESIVDGRTLSSRSALLSLSRHHFTSPNRISLQTTIHTLVLSLLLPLL